MKKEQLEAIVKDCRRKGEQFSRYSEEKGGFYDRLADQIEANFDIYLDDDYETEEDVIEDAKATIEEFDGMVDIMFDRDEDFNDEDDGIGGFLSHF